MISIKQIIFQCDLPICQKKNSDPHTDCTWTNLGRITGDIRNVIKASVRVPYRSTQPYFDLWPYANMPFTTTLLPITHCLTTLNNFFFRIFTDRILTPKLLRLWPRSKRYIQATEFLLTWAPPRVPTGVEFRAVRDTLMVELCVNNACRTGVHVGLTDGAVRQAIELDGRYVYTVSMQ